MRQNLDELAQWASAIDEAMLRTYIGGGASNDSYYYDVTTADPYGYVTDDPYGDYVTTADPYYGSVTVDPYACCVSTEDPYNMYGITTPSGDITTPIPEISTTEDASCIFDGLVNAANATINYVKGFHGPTTVIEAFGFIRESDCAYQQIYRVEYDTPIGHKICEYHYKYTCEGNDNWSGHVIDLPGFSLPNGFAKDVPCETNNGTTTPYPNGGGTPYPYSSEGGTPYPN
ncbi:MAG: hypothetical protein LBK18_01630 [Prevotellaceae bacterium]|nr:hypothetical protein [Prevotellaceae bacterium]